MEVTIPIAILASIMDGGIERNIILILFAPVVGVQSKIIMNVILLK